MDRHFWSAHRRGEEGSSLSSPVNVASPPKPRSSSKHPPRARLIRPRLLLLRRFSQRTRLSSSAKRENNQQSKRALLPSTPSEQSTIMLASQRVGAARPVKGGKDRE